MVLTSPLLEFAGLLQILSFLVLLAGCILFHRRLRRASSLSFLLSVVVAALWLYFAKEMLFYAVSPQVVPGTAAVLATMDRAPSIVALVEALISLWLVASFFLAARSIGTRPNNSFKPKPLRGSA
jgi:hypothetical protein